MITIILLICSYAETPVQRCQASTAIERHVLDETAQNAQECLLIGEQTAARRFLLRRGEYLKIRCRYPAPAPRTPG